MFHPFDHGLVVGADHRNAQRCDDAGDSGMDARIEHEVPQHQREQDIGPVARDAHLVEHHHGNHHRARCGQPAQLDVGGVEQRNHQHRPDVVDDCHGQQEQAERGGAAIAQQPENAHRESDVGRCGNGPATQQFGIAAHHADIDQCRHGHPGDGRENRQSPRLGGRQLSFDPFALHFEPDDEEEHRHQTVVDPQVKIVELRDRRPRQFAVEQLFVFARERGVGCQHGRRRNEDEQDASRRIAHEERADGGKNEAES